jgi:hypothetical protein
MILAALAACGGNKDPSCEDAIEHVAKTSKNSVNRSEKAIEACKITWNVEMRRCIVAATTDDGFMKCTREHVNVEDLKKVRDEIKEQGARQFREHVKARGGADALNGSAMKALETGSSRRIDTGSN